MATKYLHVRMDSRICPCMHHVNNEASRGLCGRTNKETVFITEFQLERAKRIAAENGSRVTFEVCSTLKRNEFDLDELETAAELDARNWLS